jgi:hypothetical protein
LRARKRIAWSSWAVIRMVGMASPDGASFFTPTGYGTELAKGKETRVIDGRGHVFETPIRADFALIKAERGDRGGNLIYRMTSRATASASSRLPTACPSTNCSRAAACCCSSEISCERRALEPR